MSARVELVRYISPFGSPAGMTRAEAARHQAEDDELWLKLSAIAALTPEQRQVGPPRIEAAR